MPHDAMDSDWRALQVAGDARRNVLDRIFEQHRARLRRLVQFRLDPILQRRVQASDVLQDAFLEADRRLDTYVDDPDMPFFVWLRYIAGQEVVKLHRHHVGAQKRDVRRQVAACKPGFPGASTVAMVDALVGRGVTPSAAAARTDLREQLQAALDLMDEQDREVLVLRHFEELSNGEVAAELGLHKDAASKRYIRALRRLRAIAEELGLETPPA